MESKDVAKVAGNGAALELKPRPLSKLSISLPKITSGEQVSDAAAVEKAPSPRSRNLDALNKVISTVNEVQEAAGTVTRLVESISGIVQQVEGGNLPKGRLAKLEEEANNLVGAIKEVALKPRSDIKTLPVDEKIKNEIEVLDKALQTIFPDSGRKEPGLGTIRFEPKEQILRVREAVLSAKEQVEALRRSVEDTQGQLRGALAAADVAAQNSEAAGSSIRDLEGALKAATAARQSIVSSPGDALNSTALTQKAIDLLRR